MAKRKQTSSVGAKPRNPRTEDWYNTIWQSVNKCVFCDLKQKYVVTEIAEMVLTANLYPYIDGHLMIIPRQHVTHIKELSVEQWEAVRTLEYVAKKTLKQLLGVSSLWLLYREGSLGQSSEKTVEHLHIHLLPFRPGLVKWNYQELDHTPLEVARMLQQQEKFITQLIQRYQQKYATA